MSIAVVDGSERVTNASTTMLEASLLAFRFVHGLCYGVPCGIIVRCSALVVGSRRV